MVVKSSNNLYDFLNVFLQCGNSGSCPPSNVFLQKIGRAYMIISLARPGGDEGYGKRVFLEYTL